MGDGYEIYINKLCFTARSYLYEFFEACRGLSNVPGLKVPRIEHIKDIEYFTACCKNAISCAINCLPKNRKEPCKVRHWNGLEDLGDYVKEEIRQYITSQKSLSEDYGTEIEEELVEKERDD